MRFVIGANNVKVFAKSILALSKIGDELYIEPLENCLTLRTVNSSKSAFACFSFNRSFFTTFEPEIRTRGGVSSSHLAHSHVDQSLLNNTTLNNEESLFEENEPFKCKIPAKCLLSIFKNITSIEKNVEKVTVQVKQVPLTDDTVAKTYDYDSTMVTRKLNKNNQEVLYETRFVVMMNSKFGMRKTFILSISDCENLQATFSTYNCTNKLNISARYLHETINSFSNEVNEISFVVEASKLNIKNYIEPETESKSSINTQVSFDSDEFAAYEIEKEIDITFCLKEFKVCLTFGNLFDLNLDIFFQRKGRPIIFKFNGVNNSYDASFTLATIAEDVSTTQQSSATPSLAASRTSSMSNNPNPMSNQSMMNRSNMNNITNSSSRLVKQASLGNEDKQTKKPPSPPSSRSKPNKRPLFDNSNQIFLENSNSEHGSASSKSNSPNQNRNNQPDSDEDDMLLTQALNEHQEMFMAKSQSNEAKKSSPPPAKKMKSLAQSLFDEDEASLADMTAAKSANKTKPTLISRLLETSGSESDSENDENHHSNVNRSKNATLCHRDSFGSKLGTSVYVDNTDSE